MSTHPTARRAPALTRLWRQEPLGVIALGVLAVVSILAIVAPWIASSPDAIDAVHRLQSPSAAHWFGTDDFGRDIFSRTVFAGRISLLLGLIVTGISAIAGAILGLFAGYFRPLESLIMRVMDGMMAFPPLVLAIALVAGLGASLTSEVIALVVVFTPRIARIAHGSTLQLRTAEYVEAAVANGSPVRTILFRHILPNALSPLVVQASFIYAEALLADAALSFLGLGVAPPTPTWGNMIADARTYLTVAPTFAAFPGLAIVISVTALNLGGDALRDLVAPVSTLVRLPRHRRPSSSAAAPGNVADGQSAVESGVVTEPGPREGAM